MGQLLDVVGRGEVATGRRAAPNTDRILFSSGLVRIGSFRCAPDHPLFNETGPTETHVMVFPRTSVWITQEDRPPFVGEPTHAALYNAVSRRTGGLEIAVVSPRHHRRLPVDR